MNQRQRVPPIDLRRKCSVELERNRSESCSSSASLVRSSVTPATGTMTWKALSTMTKTNSSMSLAHHVRRKPGNTGVQSDSFASMSDTGALTSASSGPDLSGNSSNQIQRELFVRTLSVSQLSRLSEGAEVTDAAVSAHDLAPSHFPVKAKLNNQRPVPLPRKKIPALLAAMVATSRNSQANTASVFEGAATTPPEFREMDPAGPSSKRREFTEPKQLESLVHNESMSSSPGLIKYGEPRIPNLERAVSLDFIKRHLVNTSDKLPAITSRRHLSSVLPLRLKCDAAASLPRLIRHSRSLEGPLCKGRLSPIHDAPSARPHSFEVPRPKLRRRRERPRSLQRQRAFSSNRAVSAIETTPTRLASLKRLSASTPRMDVGQSRSLDSVLAAAALLAEKELGSSFYSFSFTRSDCSNLPISLRSAILGSDNAESLPWPSRIKPVDEALTVVCSVAAIVSITLIIVVAILAATGVVNVSIRNRRASPQRLALNASASRAVDEDGNNPDSGKMPSEASSSTATSGRPGIQQHLPQGYRRKFRA
ncbi:hypothetical protein MTO96_019262 [Rhipicephalus appendiculatus]